MASKVFVDQIPPEGGRTYQLEQQGVSNQYKITDVTQYEQEGTPWTAEDANYVYEKAEGAFPSGLPDSLMSVTPANPTYVKNVTGGYVKIGHLVFVSISGQTAQIITGGSITVATGLPTPAASLVQGTGFKAMPLPAYGLHCSGSCVTTDGVLAISRAPGENYPADEDFFVTGFYYAD